MSCNCSSTHATIPAAATSGLPEIVQVYPCDAGVALVGDPACPAAIESLPSTGSALDASWTDALEVTEMTLLGRFGKKLARFKGSGFIQIVSGRARLVKNLALRVSDVWHDWWTPSHIGARPLLGNPLPFPFLVIADTAGNLHGIQGQQDATALRDSLQVWSFDRKQWEVRDIADFPALQKGLLPQVSQIEVTGFSAIPTTGAATDVRTISALAGEGLFRLKKIPTINSGCDCPGCSATPAFAYVTEFIADPVEDGEYVLTQTITDGVKAYAWVAN